MTQAAAYGLPMVATKNGGPVDIHRVCPFMHYLFNSCINFIALSSYIVLTCHILGP